MSRQILHYARHRQRTRVQPVSESPASAGWTRRASVSREVGVLLVVLGLVMLLLGVLGLLPADPHVLQVGGSHRDLAMVLAWLGVGAGEVGVGATLLIRTTSDARG